MTSPLRSAQDLRAIASESGLPPRLSEVLRALWHADRGDWTRAHDIAQRHHGVEGAWAHAYLHRLEGDLDNAAYWYRRAGKPIATDALEIEWARIVDELLALT